MKYPKHLSNYLSICLFIYLSHISVNNAWHKGCSTHYFLSTTKQQGQREVVVQSAYMNAPCEQTSLKLRHTRTHSKTLMHAWLHTKKNLCQSIPGLTTFTFSVAFIFKIVPFFLRTIKKECNTFNMKVLIRDR